MSTATNLIKTESRSTTLLLYLLYFIYFFCGMTQCFESVFLPEIKQYFHLSYQQQMYVMFAKNMPFLFSILVGAEMQRIGYKNCLTFAMVLYAAGTLLLVPGLRAGIYGIVLLAFAVIGTGFTFQMVAGNPLIGALGRPERSSSRLNFGNALGAVAQIIAPAAVTLIIPVSAQSVHSRLPYMQAIFLILGCGLIVLTLLTAAPRSLTFNPPVSQLPIHSHATSKTIWKSPKLILGFVVIFLVLGSEAGLFGFFRNYLEDPSIAGLSAHQSERLFTVYFAVFALGRLAAGWIQKYLKPAWHLLLHLAAAIFCLLVAILSKGMIAVAAIVVIGFFVSIFFPTLYAIATENLGELTGQASGLLTLGFLGCALIPVLQGRIADAVNLPFSYGIGLISYILAMLYVIHFWILTSDRNRALYLQ